MTMIELAIEALFAAALVLLAIRLLWFSRLFEAIVLLIVFGLVMTLVWAWLGAADAALAEAAIGAGLTGALLLAVWRETVEPLATPRRRARLKLPIFVAALGAALGLALQIALPSSEVGVLRLADAVADALPRSGVESPVTAVLLGFRGYDTLLEVAVLVAAWLAVSGTSGRAKLAPDEAGPVLAFLGRAWVSIAVLVSAYLLWAGSRGPGGAFQSAALLAGAAILLRLVGMRPPLRLSGDTQRALAVLGLGFFALVATAGLLARRVLLWYPPGQGGIWILALELTMAVSIAFLLWLLYDAVQHGELPS